MSSILITGVTRGIGKALALEFDRLGHQVIGCGRNEKELANLSKQLKNNPILNVVDVGNSNEVAKWAKQISAVKTKIDIIINNAGTKSRTVPLWETTEDDFQQVINTNITGIYNVVRNFVPDMVQENRGLIINISSESGRVGDAYLAPYCASKFAIEGITKSLAKEITSNMIVVAIDPFIVFTDLLADCRSLFLPGEYEQAISPTEWAQIAVANVFKLTTQDNGKSLTWRKL